MSTNLPPKILEDSAAGTRLFFDSYGNQPLEFSAVDVNSAQVFFQSKGFSEEASVVLAITLLRQAKFDKIPIFQILDTVQGFSSTEINLLVGKILNNNRVPISALGFKTSPVFTNETRNISP